MAKAPIPVLMGLPIEVRIGIYYYLIPMGEWVYFYNGMDCGNGQLLLESRYKIAGECHCLYLGNYWRISSFMQVHSTIYQDLCEQLYSTNYFEMPCFRRAQAFFDQIGPKNCSLLRNVRFLVACPDLKFNYKTKVSGFRWTRLQLSAVIAKLPNVETLVLDDFRRDSDKYKAHWPPKVLSELKMVRDLQPKLTNVFVGEEAVSFQHSKGVSFSLRSDAAIRTKVTDRLREAQPFDLDKEWKLYRDELTRRKREAARKRRVTKKMETAAK